MRRVLVGGSLSVSLLFAAPVAAAEMDQVRADVEAGLAWVSLSAGGLVHHAPVQVQAEAGAYRVVLPQLRFGPTGDVAFGPLEFRLKPQSPDSYEVTDLRLPPRISFDVPGGETVAVELPSQSLTGIFSKKIGNFVALDARFENLRIGPEQGGGVLLELLAMEISSQEKGADRLDQQTRYAVEKLSASMPDGRIEIGAIEMSTEARDWRAAEYGRLTQDFYAQLSRIGPEGGVPPDPAKLFAILRELFSLMPAMAATFSVRDIAGYEPGGDMAFALREFGLALGAGSPEPDRTEIRFALHHAGLDLPESSDPVAAAMAQFVPADAALDLRLEDLPGKALLDLLFRAIELASRADPNVEAQQAALGEEGFALLTGAGTKLRVVDSFAEIPLARLDLQGVLTAHAGAVHRVFGELAVKIRGFDALVKAADEIARAQGGGRQAAAVLELVRGFSKRETLADGTVVDTYTLSLVPTGQVVLNGKDVTGLLGGP